MRNVLVIVAVCWVACWPLTVTQGQEAGHREASAHEHGAGVLNMALEDKVLSIELTVPGDDIVGFEHAAKTKSQKAAVARAKSALGKPMSLFVPSKDAGCAVTSAKVSYEGGGDHAGHEHGKGHGGHKHGHGGEKAKPKEVEASHAEFRSTYTFHCEAPDKLMAMGLAYFQVFPKTQKLEVNLVSAKGQSKQVVTGKSGSMSLSGRL